MPRCDDCIDWETQLVNLPTGTTVHMKCHTCGRSVVASTGSAFLPLYAFAALVVPILLVLLCLWLSLKLS